MRDATRAAVVAVLATLAVTFAAATLDSAVTVDPGGSDGPGAGQGSGEGGIATPSDPATPGQALQLPFLDELLLLMTALAALAVLAYLFVHWRRVFAGLAAVAVAVVVAYVLSQFLSPQAFEPAPPALPEPVTGSPAGGGGSDQVRPSPAPLVALVVLAVVAVGAFTGVGRSRSTDETTPDDDAGGSSRDRAAALGRAAGRAADELAAGGEVENEVYRAWREMTRLLDVDSPETTTPGEFERAAVAAGLDRGDVRELTRLFEAVRYGDAEPDGDRERRAIEAFRRIETAAAEPEGEP